MNEGYTKEQVDLMRANLCARWENEWALLECRVKAAEMLGSLYNAWRDSASQADELRLQVEEARIFATTLLNRIKQEQEIYKQRDEARVEVQRLNDTIEEKKEICKRGQRPVVMNTEYKIQSRLMGRQVNATGGYGYLPLMQHFVCKDGFKVSIQASAFHYCAPRTNYGPWYEVELGYPSEPMPELAEYCDAYGENKLKATQTVWGCVPIAMVAKILDDHGGIVPEGDE